jgi:hypothetical protein
MGELAHPPAQRLAEQSAEATALYGVYAALFRIS